MACKGSAPRSASDRRAEIDKAISSIAKKLGLSSLKTQQEKALQSFLLGHDLFVSLPTGFGKSVVYQAAPFCHDMICDPGPGNEALAVVVMPLKTLISDQLARLHALGIEAADLSQGLTDDIREGITNGHLSILLTSPEFITGDTGRDFFKCDSVKRRLCGLFIDESHCVMKWGHASGNTKAFRESYGKLGELRSILPPVPVVALTATATHDVRNSVAESLSMRNYVLISESPDKSNIKHVVVRTQNQNFEETFRFLIDDVKENGQRTDRVLIFCQSRKVVADLYGLFKYMLPETHTKFVNMYHTNTERDVQSFITEDFANPDGEIRILIATIAYGMGVDVKGVHTAIMCGQPSDLDDYLQMAGRVGRDGRDSVVITLKYPGDIKGRGSTTSMQQFMKGNECRREAINNSFGSNPSRVTKHKCCDVCAGACDCGLDTCCVSNTERALRESMDGTRSLKDLTVQVPSSEKLDKLERMLEGYRDSLLSENPDHLYSGKDIASGLPQSTITSIIADSNVVLPKKEFFRRYCFLNVDVGDKCWEMYTNVLERTESTCMSSDNELESDSSENSEEFEEWSGDEYADAVLSASDSDTN